MMHNSKLSTKVSKIKLGRNHPFVMAFEREIMEAGFEFHTCEYYERFITFTKKIDDTLSYFIDLIFQPGTCPFFSVRLGVHSYMVRDDYNQIRLWECYSKGLLNVNYTYPLDFPLNIVSRNLVHIRRVESPNLKARWKYGSHDIDIDSEISELMNDLQQFGLPFLDSVNSHEAVLKYLELLSCESSDVTILPSEKDMMCWGSIDLIMLLLKNRLRKNDEILQALAKWYENKKSIYVKNYSSENLIVKRELYLKALACEYDKFKKVLFS